MEDTNRPLPGTVGWFDLTVGEASRVRDFYHSVAGWDYEELSMGEYNDYVMTLPNGGIPVAGICHAKGANKSIPPVWMMYINVENIRNSVESCLKLGGKLTGEIKQFGDQGFYCIIEDPAGAPVALFQHITAP